MPRYFGFAFNPVSIYYCYGAADLTVPELVVLEVNNTFGESFVYCLHPERGLSATRRG